MVTNKGNYLGSKHWAAVNFMLKKRIKNRILCELAELGIALVIAAVVFFVSFNFVARTGYVNGLSMEPTLFHGETVFINKAAYWFKKPVLGDIVAFPYPRDPEKQLIKRVIGTAGDEIDFVNGIIYLNGELLPPEYRMDTGGGHTVPFPLIVPDGTVFVLGDNRWASEDSRYREVGCIPIGDLTGKVPFRLYPFNQFGLLK
ncbi:MAG: signal peptidase I [Defluviitaleaceae bacterium]|nr:signal peptidase I [Defluviitaleaceae bacterium]MCL2836833.1 signal peptidase I [Defluviitaleaceae bacterium]